MSTHELKDHSGWYVRITWMSGHVEDVDVSSEAEANDWIKKKSSGWLSGRRLNK